METLLKIFIALLIPNLLLTYVLSKSLKSYEYDTDINTTQDINVLYFMATLIVMLPICLSAYFYFFPVNGNDSMFAQYLSFTASTSLFLGIIISIINISYSSKLKPVKK